MKIKIILLILFLHSFGMVFGQSPYLFDHTYPFIAEEQPLIRNVMDKVSIDSLEATIQHFQDYHTRQWNSHMVYDVQDWIYNTYLNEDFDSVFLQDFPVDYHDTLYETSDNVIAIKKGLLYPDEYVVCGAHYDSYNNSPGDPDSLRAPGADDNASGAAGILETARLLSRCTFERSVVFCHFAAEEIGLYGSTAYAKDCANRLMDIVGYFNLDMIGYLEEGSDIHVNLLYRSRDTLIAHYVLNFCDVYFPDMGVWHSWLPAGSDSDFSSFNRNGYASIQTFEDSHHYSPFIHSPNDLLGQSVNSMDQVKRFTQLNLGLVATLAGLVSNGVDDVVSESLKVYPNPVSETLIIKGLPMREVSVYNMMGQRVINETCHEDEIHLDVSSLAAGVYVLRVVDKAMLVHSSRIVIY